MTDKVIRVNVTASKSQKVTVSSSKVANEITASPDTSAYYSRLAKNWAIAEGLVENIDYSSKHYAQESKASADMAKTYEISTQENYNMFMEASVNANSELQTNRDGALADIEESRAGAVDSLNSVKDENIASIEAKGDSLTSEITSLSNGYISQINTTGKSYDNLTHRNITNCLTEVPQRIKLELKDGTLTLKAGSVVIVPNGFEADGTTPKFDEVIIESDISTTEFTNQTNLMALTNNGTTLFSRALANCTSGASATTTFGYAYDTTTNKINWHKSSGDIGGEYVSFPICKVSANGASINQVFNGFGYIGSTIWVDKGVKGLIPNGRNEDGTLRNIEWVTNAIKTCETHTSNVTQPYVDIETNKLKVSTTDFDDLYNEEENHFYYDGVKIFPLTLGSSFNQSGTKTITSFNPKQPFRAVDYSDLTELMPTGAIISSASSTTPTGYLYCNGSAVSRTTYAKLFSVIGTTYGTGDGSTTFNLPNYSNYNFVTSSTVSVKATGKTLGFMDGNGVYTGTRWQHTSGDYGLSLSIGCYGASLPGKVSDYATGGENLRLVGLTTDASKSGITGNVSTKALKWYIKY